MNRSKSKISEIALSFLICVIFAVSLVFISGCNIFGDNTDEEKTVTESSQKDPYITSVEPIYGGFMAIYSDGSSKEFLYPKVEETEKPEEKAYVVSIAHDDGSLVITYSNGTASLLPISTQSSSSSGSTSNPSTGSSSTSSGRYVTAIFDDGEGNLSVKYSNGTSDTIKKDDIELKENDEVYITKVEQTSTGIKVTYSDGTGGSIISVGDLSVSLNDIYNSYKDSYSADISLEDFLKKFLNVEAKFNDSADIVAADRLRSAIKINTEFAETSGVKVYSGSGVIWKIYNDYTYIVTNYHVVYSVNAYLSQNNGSYIARGIYASLYGNEGKVTYSGSNYSYGSNAFKCDYVGGAINVDLAVIRVATSTIKAINPDIQEIACAESYHVGETAIAIGNPLGEGISVTKGVVSKESEDINLQLDNTIRSYRCMRIDTSIYHGSSGGGLYNLNGELIGITNGGNEAKQNINYAIPVNIVSGVADGIIYNDRDGNSATNGVYTLNIGADLTAKDVRYVYDSVTGYGKVKGKVVISSISSTSFLKVFNLKAGDIIYSITIDKKEYLVENVYDVTEALYHVRVGSKIAVTTLNENTGNVIVSSEDTIEYSDLVSVK